MDISTRDGMGAALAMLSDGYSYADVAGMCNVAGVAISVGLLKVRVSRYRRAGIAPRVKVPAITRETMQDMVDRGMTPTEASEELGVSCNMIMWYEKRLGLRLQRAYKKRDDDVIDVRDMPAYYFLPDAVKELITGRWTTNHFVNRRRSSPSATTLTRLLGENKQGSL